MPRTGPHSVPAPKAATGTISHAATIGARPKVDSSDRSMPPIMMIRLSPTTTMPERRDLLADAGQVRNREEDRARDRADDQEHDDHRQERRAAHERHGSQPAASAARTAARARWWSTVSEFADVGHRLSPHGHQAFGGCDQLLVVVRRLGELGEHLAANEHDHAIADLQVVELIACEQQAGAGRRA